MRVCMFCNKKANTAEDVWPVWLMKRFDTTGNAYIEGERGGQELRWRARKPRLTIKCVCASCNNGWMSQLESEAKPVIESILDDKVTSVGVAAQTTLARWSVKIAMVLEAVGRHRSWFYSERERRSMRVTLSIPEHTSVWIAKCVDSPSVFNWSRDLKTLSGENSAHAYLTTIAFGSLAIQVFSIKTHSPVPADTAITYDVRNGPWDEVLVPVWPISQNSQTWPPYYGLNGEFGLSELASRLSPEPI